MVFNFLYPALLFIAVPLAGAVVYMGWKGLKRMARWKRNSILAFRAINILLLVLMLAGASIRFFTNDTTTIFVVDASDSTAKMRQEAERFIRDAIPEKKDNDRIGIVSFGTDSAVELLPPANRAVIPGNSSTADTSGIFYRLQTVIDGGSTNIEGALRFASSIFPGGTRKRMVLMTDGRENAGKAAKEIKLLGEQGIILDIYPLQAESGPEVLVKSVDIPQSTRINEYYDVQVMVNSNVRTGAELKLFQGNSMISSQRVELQAGDNSFVFREQAVKGGTVVYRAEIDAAADESFKNNEMSSFTKVKDIPGILILQGENEGGRELVKLLEGDIRVKVLPAGSAPTTVEGLSEFDSIIISDVSVDELNDDFLASLEVVVKHMGKGLIVTGGENSYALGGYDDTVFEKILPVNMEIRKKEEIPNIGLGIIIDKSGSMSGGMYGVSKLELAKEAAIRATSVLTPKDEIGVIAFDEAVQWVVKNQKLTDLKKVQDDIATIRPGGGTSILPALDEGVKAVENMNTKLKHIILLTDGQAEKNGYQGLLDETKREGITISTVAVGADSDLFLLEYLAKEGGGRYYYSDEFSDLPQIFTKETYLAAKTYVNNRTFYPQPGSYAELLKGINSVPSLDGYIGTTAKDTARVVLSSDQEDPILAVWQYGSGKTAAWTPDASGKWTEGWMQWENSPVFWKSLVSWVLQRDEAGDYVIKGSTSGKTGEIQITFNNLSEYDGTQMKAFIIDPELNEQEAEMQPVAPGQYKAQFSGSNTGVYVLRVDASKDGEVQKSFNSALAIPYSPEYLPLGKEKVLDLSKAAEDGGGKLLTDPKDVFGNKLPEVWNDIDLTPLLLTVFIILFVFDIALRRLNISPEKIRWVIEKSKNGMQAGVAGLRSAASIVNDSLASSTRSVFKHNDTNVQKDSPSGKIPNSKDQSKSTDKVKYSSNEQSSAGGGMNTSRLLESKKKRERKD